MSAEERARTREVTLRGDDNSMNRRRIRTVFKWALYWGVIIFLYVAMVTPKSFENKNTSPLMLIPFLVSLAMYEGEVAAAATAVLVGLLWSSSSDIFWGFHSLTLFIIAVFCGAIVQYYFKRSIVIALPLTALSIVFYFLLSYYVHYGVWSYAGASALVKSYYIPAAISTVVSTPIAYFLVKGVNAISQMRFPKSKIKRERRVRVR